MTEAFQSLVEASKSRLKSTDYVKDGLYHCGLCHTPRQCRVTLLGMEFLPICLCRCEAERQIEEEERRRYAALRERVASKRSAGIPQELQGWTFENDRGYAKELTAKALRYATQWERMRRENIGLLLWGSAGSGKSYAAACIANRLVENDTAVFMRSLSALFTQWSAMSLAEKPELLHRIATVPLLVLDDFGTQRSTDYAQEQVFSLLDARYLSRKPLILTTNLSLEELKAPRDKEHERIYSRILEQCLPIRCTAPSIRPRLGKEKWARAVRCLEEGP